MKITITEKEKHLNGTIETGKVTPAGTGGHIISKREHLGKNVHVVIPENPIYSWVLDEKTLKDALKYAEIQIRAEGDKTWQYRLEAIQNIKLDNFDIEDLNVLVKALKRSNETKIIKLGTLIAKTYCLN